MPDWRVLAKPPSMSWPRPRPGASPATESSSTPLVPDPIVRVAMGGHKKGPAGHEKILRATDFSPHAHDAGRQALDCAKCSDRPIDVLTVVAPDKLPTFQLDVPDPFLPPAAVHETERRLDAEYEERARQELTGETRFLTDVGIEVALHIRVGSLAEEIVAAATELASDLIVIGAHGRRSLEELLLGSTVDNVTKPAPCPVLVAR